MRPWLAAGPVGCALLLTMAAPLAADLTPVPLPSPDSVQLGPLETPPLPDGAQGAVTAVTGAAAPTGAGWASPAAPLSGRTAASGAAGTGDEAATQEQPSEPAYRASPEERALLVPEPERYEMEGQQARLRDAAPGMERTDGPLALAAGRGSGSFSWPVRFAGRPPITQYFGCTDLPGEPYSRDCVTHRFHSGIDLGVRSGAPVLASAPGVAHVYRSGSGYGNHVLVVHGSGWFTLYAHLSDVSVSDGQLVGRGDTLGPSGSTGFSTGPHLHFEIRYGQDPVDPLAHLTAAPGS